MLEATCVTRHAVCAAAARDDRRPVEQRGLSLAAMAVAPAAGAPPSSSVRWARRAGGLYAWMRVGLGIPGIAQVPASACGVPGSQRRVDGCFTRPWTRRVADRGTELYLDKTLEPWFWSARDAMCEHYSSSRTRDASSLLSPCMPCSVMAISSVH